MLLLQLLLLLYPPLPVQPLVLLLPQQVDEGRLPHGHELALAVVGADVVRDDVAVLGSEVIARTLFCAFVAKLRCGY